MTRQRLMKWSVEAIYWLVIAWVWYVLLFGADSMLRPKFWYAVMKVCHRIAYTTGRVAITAEVIYRAAMEEAKL